MKIRALPYNINRLNKAIALLEVNHENKCDEKVKNIS